MYKVNENYLKIQGNYLFSTIARKVNEFSAQNPDKEVIRLGIGDVTQPLAPVLVQALQDAVTEMASADTFHGYAPIWATNFCAKQSRKMITRQEGVRLMQTKFLYPMAQNVTAEIFRKFSVQTIRWQCVILFTRYMWTRM